MMVDTCICLTIYHLISVSSSTISSHLIEFMEEKPQKDFIFMIRRKRKRRRRRKVR